MCLYGKKYWFLKSSPVPRTQMFILVMKMVILFFFFSRLLALTPLALSVLKTNMLGGILRSYVEYGDGKLGLCTTVWLAFRLLGVLLSVASSFSLSMADAFENPVKVVDYLPRKKCTCVNISVWLYGAHRP